MLDTMRKLALLVLKVVSAVVTGACFVGFGLIVLVGLVVSPIETLLILATVVIGISGGLRIIFFAAIAANYLFNLNL